MQAQLRQSSFSIQLEAFFSGRTFALAIPTALVTTKGGGRVSDSNRAQVLASLLPPAVPIVYHGNVAVTGAMQDLSIWQSNANVCKTTM